MQKNSHSALSFEEGPRSVIMALAMRWMRIPAQRAPSQSPVSATCRRTAINRSSFSNGELNEISFKRSIISRAERGVPGRSTGFDLHQDRIARRALAHQWRWDWRRRGFLEEGVEEQNRIREAQHRQSGTACHRTDYSHW
jgi:hypothetical protein